jgi:hypothetical protein
VSAPGLMIAAVIALAGSLAALALSISRCW